MLTNLIFLQTPAAEVGGSGMINLLIIVGIVVVFYFFMIRPQTKRQKEIKKFREALTVGDNVVTAGGIHGKIRKVQDTTFVVEIAPNTTITIEKSSIYPSGSQEQPLNKDAQ